MIPGIMTSAAFVFVSAVFFTQKLKNGSRIKHLFSAIHKPLGYLLLALAIVHLALALRLIRQRPAMIYILGIAMMICIAAGIIAWRRIKNKHKALVWHKLCALVSVLLLIVHIAFCMISLKEYQREVAAISFFNPEISFVADGQYTGECDVGYYLCQSQSHGQGRRCHGHPIACPSQRTRQGRRGGHRRDTFRTAYRCRCCFKRHKFQQSD